MLKGIEMFARNRNGVDKKEECVNLNKSPLDIKGANPRRSRFNGKRPGASRKDTPKAYREVTVKVSASLAELALVGFLALAGAGFFIVRKKFQT